MKNLAYVNTGGPSFEDCVDKARDIIGKVLSTEAKSACPWFDNVVLDRDVYRLTY